MDKEFDPNQPMKFRLSQVDKPTELSPSQLFEQNKEDLIKIFEREPEKLPENISKYKIIKELGRGGMGCVYKAHDPQMNRFIALKVILSGGKEQEKVIQRFIQEAKAMGQFSHPNIVRVYDIGKDGNNHFITMDYIEGQSLKEYLQNTPLNVRQFSKLMVKIANAIQYAHEKGIIHRDLKPANIMLDKTSKPQVMDFGLAKLNKVEKSLSKKGAVLGTPQYMSPEQARGEEVDNLTDVYSLGAIFYEMLAGKPMIQGQTVPEIMFTLLNREPDLLRKINPDLSLDLEVICHKTITKEKDQRYQSTKEFSEDLERFLSGELIKAKSASSWEKFKNKFRKNKLTVVTSAAGILLIILGVWASERYQRADISNYLVEAKRLQQKAENQNIAEKKMKVYSKANNLLEKALEISPNDLEVKKRLFDVKKTMGTLAKKQKNYLLSFALFKQCQNLNNSQGDNLLEDLEKDKEKLKETHSKFVKKVMKKVSKKTPKALVDRYAFTIVKMQKPYVVKLLIQCICL